MGFNVEAFVWYLFLADSLVANTLAWCCPKWSKKKYKKFYKHFPTTKGWGLLYLGLVLWIGVGLFRLAILPW